MSSESCRANREKKGGGKIHFLILFPQDASIFKVQEIVDVLPKKEKKSIFQKEAFVTVSKKKKRNYHVQHRHPQCHLSEANSGFSKREEGEKQGDCQNKTDEHEGKLYFSTGS